MKATMHLDQRQLDAGVAYETCRAEGLEALDAGRLEQALGHFEQAFEIAKRDCDQSLADLAFCNCCALTITLDRFDEFQPLREVLVRNRNGETSFAAAYNLARAYEYTKSSKKSVFYAQIARDRALPLESMELLAKAHVQLGKGFVAESRFDEAIEEFESALALLPPEMNMIRATALVNLAYPKLLRGETEEAFRCAFNSLRWYRRAGQRTYETWPHITLCFAYNEIGKTERAIFHGEQGLELARETGDQQAMKAALFLMGEARKSEGDYDRAYECFQELQQAFYPDNPQVPQLMLFTDSRALVNMKA